jgi:hypothetical protein
MAKKATQKKSHAGEVAAGVGLAAAAAGVYYLFKTKSGAKARASAARWASGLQKDVLKELKNVTAAGEKEYKKVIHDVAERYEKLKGIDSKDLASLVRDLEGHWSAVRKEFTAGAQAVKKTVNKSMPEQKTPPKTTTKRRVAKSPSRKKAAVKKNTDA